MARRINRRGFILSSGAGFAAASLVGCGGAPPVADSEMAEGSSMAAGPSFLVGFQRYSMRHFSELDAFLPQAEKLGLGYVELYRGHLATEASPEQIQVVKQSLAGLGIKVNAFDKDWQTIVAKGDTAWRLQRNGGNNSVEFACTGLPVPGALVGSLFGTVGVNDGRWHHVAGTFDGARVCLYVDGRLDMAAEAPGSIAINNANVFIGANAEKPNRCWSGRIDDVRIYSYALSDSEVAALASDVPTALPR